MRPVLNFHYFIHAWSNIWYDTKTGFDSSKQQVQNIDLLTSELTDLYQPKQLVVEDQDQCETLSRDAAAIKILIDRITDGPHPVISDARRKVLLHSLQLGQEFFNIDSDARRRLILSSLKLGLFYSLERATNLKIEHEKSNDMLYDATIRFRLDCMVDPYNQEYFFNNIGFRQSAWHGGKEKCLQFKYCKIREGKLAVGDILYGGDSNLFNSLCTDIYKFLLADIHDNVGEKLTRWPERSSEHITAKKLLTINNMHSCKLPANVRFTVCRDYHVEANVDTYDDAERLFYDHERSGVTKS